MTKKQANFDVPEDWVPLLAWPEYFYPQQRDFTLSEKFQDWFVAGNGAGKTRQVYWNTLAQLLGVHPKQLAPPPLRAKVLVPSFEYVEEEVLPKMTDSAIISHKGIEIGPMRPQSTVVKDFNARGFRGIRFNNGSIIRFATSEQGWKLMRGAEFDILVCDEEPDERVFDENLRGLRNAKGGGRVYGGLTPPYEEGQGPTWTKERIVEAEDPDIDVFRACMMDNPAITEDFIRRFSQGKSPEQIRVQVYGEYPSWGDVIHPAFVDRLWDAEKGTGHLLPNDYELPENWEVDWFMAFDWHASKECASVWGFRDSDNNVIFYEELDPWVAKGKEISELADIFYQLEGHPHDKRRFRRWQDPSAKSTYNAVSRGFNAWDEFRKYGIITAEGKNRNPEVGISIVNEYLKGNCKDHPRVFFRENMVRTRQALKNHYWKKSKVTGKAEPDAKWSDFPICVRYILQEIGSKHKKEKKSWPSRSIDTLRNQPERISVRLM